MDNRRCCCVPAPPISPEASVFTRNPSWKSWWPPANPKATSSRYEKRNQPRVWKVSLLWCSPDGDDHQSPAAQFHHRRGAHLVRRPRLRRIQARRQRNRSVRQGPVVFIRHHLNDSQYTPFLFCVSFGFPVH